ncbi:MFS transporter, partial [Enterobacter quasiroggenkampii]|nr:MFS transporter [Enterobacter quasiroggenkampii]
DCKLYRLVDVALFRNRFFTSATFANFLINTVAGTLLITNTFVQQVIGLSSFETGLVSLTYLIAVLTMIRVGEKILQEFGPRKPMLIGTMSTTVGIFLMSITFLPIPVYIALCVIGFLLFGLGLGLFATPSTDTAISHSPEEKV